MNNRGQGAWTELSTREKLLAHRERWHAKPALAALYQEQIFERIRAHRASAGLDVELGTGGGFYSASAPGTFATDIATVEWVDLVCDATALPMRSGSVGNLVGIDLLHHIQRPGRLLDEAERVLRPGGRLLLVEPWLSPLGALFYRHLHHEPCDPGEDPFAPGSVGAGPFDANVARPWLLFCQHRHVVSRRWPKLTLQRLEPFGGPCWILSGGFRRWGLLPRWAVGPGLEVEEWLFRPLAQLLSLRVLVVLERGF